MEIHGLKLPFNIKIGRTLKRLEFEWIWKSAWKKVFLSICFQFECMLIQLTEYLGLVTNLIVITIRLCTFEKYSLNLKTCGQSMICQLLFCWIIHSVICVHGIFYQERKNRLKCLWPNFLDPFQWTPWSSWSSPTATAASADRKFSPTLRFSAKIRPWPRYGMTRQGL